MREKTNNKLVILFFAAFFSWIIYLAGSTFIENHLLKNEGKCGKAILTNFVIHAHNLQRTLQYEFTYKGKTYTGDSLEDDLTKAGDSVCIIYLESYPGMNRAVKYFDGDKLPCNCSN
jgi:hypothetical protein